MSETNKQRESSWSNTMCEKNKLGRLVQNAEEGHHDGEWGRTKKRETGVTEQLPWAKRAPPAQAPAAAVHHSLPADSPPPHLCHTAASAAAELLVGATQQVRLRKDGWSGGGRDRD